MTPTITSLYIIIVAGMKMHARKEVHCRITNTPKRGVTYPVTDPFGGGETVEILQRNRRRPG